MWNSTFDFWREATAASVPGFLCQSGRRRPENVSILSSLLMTGRELFFNMSAWPKGNIFVCDENFYTFLYTNKYLLTITASSNFCSFRNNVASGMSCSGYRKPTSRWPLSSSTRTTLRDRLSLLQQKGKRKTARRQEPNTMTRPKLTPREPKSPDGQNINR